MDTYGGMETRTSKSPEGRRWGKRRQESRDREDQSLGPGDTPGKEQGGGEVSARARSAGVQNSGFPDDLLSACHLVTWAARPPSLGLSFPYLLPNEGLNLMLGTYLPPFPIPLLDEKGKERGGVGREGGSPIGVTFPTLRLGPERRTWMPASHTMAL